jgi:hypothetical protein
MCNVQLSVELQFDLNLSFGALGEERNSEKEEKNA